MAFSSNYPSTVQCKELLGKSQSSVQAPSWLRDVGVQFGPVYVEISIYGLLLLVLSSGSYQYYKNSTTQHSLSWRSLRRPLTIWSVFSIVLAYSWHRAMEWNVLFQQPRGVLGWVGILTIMIWSRQSWQYRLSFSWHQVRRFMLAIFCSARKAIGTFVGKLKHRKTISTMQRKFWRKLTWRWMNPLFLQGFKSRLGSGDVPKLPAECEAQKLQSSFRSDIDLSSALVRCFWQEFLITGLLAACKVCVMYVGPALINSFVKHSTSERHHYFDLHGYFLVLILLLSKFVDTLSSQHFTFQCQKLGLKVRSTLSSAVFRKGLCLSNSARQEYGVGQMVNFMSVDVPQVANTIGALHNIWMLPLQVTVALILLYSVVGWAMLAGVATLVMLVTFTTWTSRLQRRNQACLLKAKDARMKATNEALTSMKVIKLHGWESYFAAKLASCRADECKWISAITWTMGSVMTIRLLLSGAVVSIATFTACLLVGVELTPGSVFTAVATLRLLQDPIRVFPLTVNDICKAQVSLHRLQAYLHSKELEVDAKDAESLPEHPNQLCVEEGEFSWEEDSSSRSTLRNLNVKVKNGELLACVGAVGSGKSSFLASVLGEMHKLNGQVRVRGSMAYVPQIPWIQNGTIEENILFGKPMDKIKYMEALKVCQLECDMTALEFGDQTEIGERGINLSGGQKQRIQLARAVYQDSDVYLLDDIFSSVDAHTGSGIFMECVKGALRTKTIILVTHKVEFLQEVDRILVMSDGTITESGNYKDLLGCSPNFEALLTAHNKAVKKAGIKTSPQENAHTYTKATVHSKTTVDDKISLKKNLIEEERWSKAGKRVYWLYANKAYGPWCIILLFLIQGAWQTLSIWGDYWLANVTSSKTLSDPFWFIGVYAAFSIGSWVCVLLRTSLGLMAGTRTAQNYYEEMMQGILHAPMSFFDTTPSSRILNRSSADQSVLDVTLPGYFGSGFSICFSLLGTLFVMCQTSWPILFVVLPLAYLYFLYQAYFIATSRKLTRMRSLTTAPIIHHFSESMAGSAVIRCFKKQAWFYHKHMTSMNENVRMVYYCNAASAWLAYRLEMIGTIVLCTSALLLVLLRSRWLSPQSVGLSLSYGLSLNGALYWTVWLFCELETHMVAVERVKQYTELPSEHVVADSIAPSAKWPSVGAITLQNLQVRYQPSTPLVLKGISVTIGGGERVGVVGRTGSGKSALVQALFRLVEPAGGSVLMDGIDISTVPLSILRSRVGIIPQEPTLFHGTVRSNIDPLGHHSDDAIWEALKSCQLAAFVRGQPGQLAAPVMNEGSNWSVGQKQLLCLGRAFLRCARILVLDEASASLDASTEGVIQAAISTGFPTSTIINIAHRIPSIVECSDRVLVLQAGRVREYDTPRTLMADPDSLFRSMLLEFSALPSLLIQSNSHSLSL